MNTMVKMGSVYPLKLREARRARGLTQGDLAELLGVGSSTVCSWERGRCTPSKVYWCEIERILGIDRSIFECYDCAVIASLLRRAREELGLSKRKLARLAAVDDCTITRIERVGRCQTLVLVSLTKALLHIARLRGKNDAVPAELVDIAAGRLKNWTAGKRT